MDTYFNASDSGSGSGADERSMGMIWAWSLLAVTIVTAAALLGPLFLPLLRRNSNVGRATVALLVALGAGVLLGDAILHLLPQAFGIHGHDHGDDHDHDHDHVHDEDEHNHYDSMFIGLMLFAGVYVFYVIDKNIAAYLGVAHDHEHDHDFDVAAPKEYKSVNVDSESRHLLVGNNDSSTLAPIERVKPVAWLVLIGDGAHNIVDGIAIGVSFLSSNELGWITTIAILCHEIPHEIGDFAILLASGMSVKRAIGWIAMMQVVAYFGLGLGLSLGTIEGSEPFLLAFTAGMFIYISLTNLMPELAYQRKVDTACIVASRHIGLLMGMAIMVIVVVLEVTFE